MTIARDRWQQHLKTRGAYYHDQAAALEAVNAAPPEVGAPVGGARTTRSPRCSSGRASAAHAQPARPASGSASSSPSSRAPAASPGARRPRRRGQATGEGGSRGSTARTLAGDQPRRRARSRRSRSPRTGCAGRGRRRPTRSWLEAGSPRPRSCGRRPGCSRTWTASRTACTPHADRSASRGRLRADRAADRRGRIGGQPRRPSPSSGGRHHAGRARRAGVLAERLGGRYSIGDVPRERWDPTSTTTRTRRRRPDLLARSAAGCASSSGTRWVGAADPAEGGRADGLGQQWAVASPARRSPTPATRAAARPRAHGP
jgi:hypothetical protein